MNLQRYRIYAVFPDGLYSDRARMVAQGRTRKEALSRFDKLGDLRTTLQGAKHISIADVYGDENEMIKHHGVFVGPFEGLKHIVN